MFSVELDVLACLQRYFQVDANLYPGGYSQHYRSRSQAVSIPVSQFDLDVQRQLHTVAAILDFALTQPLQFAIALQESQFQLMLQHQLKLLPAALRSAIVLREAVDSFTPNLFVYDDLQFDVDRAVELIQDLQPTQIDFTKLYPTWAAKLSPATVANERTETMIVAQLPRSLGTYLPISGWQQMAQSYEQTEAVVLPAYFLSPQQSQQCLLTEYLRPLWIAESY